MPKAPASEQLMIPGPAGSLEALLEMPGGIMPRCVGVLCHPHPLHGGTMLNKVVHTFARALTDLGLAALRFNFRGVGASKGEYAAGDGEIDDVVAVAAYVRNRWPDADVWLGGFSFGAVVAARAAAQIRPARLITIAPAVNILGRKLSRQPDVAWLVIQGDADEIVPAADVMEWVNGLEPGPELILLPGVGHFFHGHLVELRETLISNLGKA
jgi:alpha/beta superfamily hydrolase